MNWWSIVLLVLSSWLVLGAILCYLFIALARREEEAAIEAELHELIDEAS